MTEVQYERMNTPILEDLTGIIKKYEALGAQDTKQETLKTFDEATDEVIKQSCTSENQEPLDKTLRTFDEVYEETIDELNKSKQHSIQEYHCSMTLKQLPSHLTDEINFIPLDDYIKDLQGVTLFEIIKKHTNQVFPQTMTKYCYRLAYKDLTFTYLEARDNYADTIVKDYASSYTKQHMHSISGEQTDLCYYTYAPKELFEFLNMNKGRKYSFLPITVYPVDSANGIRHDMLLIFDNVSKLFYWFDCKNREDYMPVSTHNVKNSLDVLFINFSSILKLGYTYEPSPSWQIQGVFHSYGSIGSLDFLLSTAWCYNMIKFLDYYDSPIGYMSILDGLNETDRFNLVYHSMLHMLTTNYSKFVPKGTQVDLTSAVVKPITDLEISSRQTTTTMVMPQPILQPITCNSQPTTLQPITTAPSSKLLSLEPEPEPEPKSKIQHAVTNSSDGLRQRTTSTVVHQTNELEMQPMPITTSVELNKKNNNCHIM